jgi:hypothetical protein
MSDRALRAEAEALYEQRLDDLKHKAEQEKEAEREQGIRSALKDIQEQRRQERIAQNRREAEARAADLSRERYELAEEMEAAAANLNRLLSEYESLHSRQADALRQAGRPLDHGYRLQELISVRFRQWFGGWNSLSGVQAPFHGAQNLPLPERDPLASSEAG